jgi:hypothetical protein
VRECECEKGVASSGSFGSPRMPLHCLALSVSLSLSPHRDASCPGADGGGAQGHGALRPAALRQHRRGRADGRERSGARGAVAVGAHASHSGAVLGGGHAAAHTGRAGGCLKLPPTVSLSPSLSLCLFHCVSHCVSLTVSPTLSHGVPPHRLSHGVPFTVPLTVSPTVPHGVSLTASPCACRWTLRWRRRCTTRGTRSTGRRRCWRAGRRPPRPSR